MGKVKRVYHSQLRSEQAEVTRRRILDAAQRLFARQGYQDVTMDRLAEEAGVAVQTLYAVFGSKVNLARAVVDQALADIGLPELTRQASAISDAEEALRFVAHVNCLVGERMVALDALLSFVDVREMSRTGDRSREQDVGGALATVLRSPRRRADVSDDEARDTLVALTSKALYRTLVVERGWATERYERWLSNLLIGALLR